MNFSGSRALSEGLEILKSRFGVLIGTTLIFYVALFAIMAAFGGSMMQVMMAGAGGDPSQAMAGMGLTFLLMYLLIYAVQFTQALATMRLCSDRHTPSIGDAIGAGFRGMPTLFGSVVILVVVGLIGGVILGLILGLVMAAVQSPSFGILLALIGVIGGIYLAARLSMLVPVIAIDDERNPIKAISRSWGMTGSAALKIALVYGAAIVLVVVVFFVLLALTIGTSAFTGGQPNPAGAIGFVIGMLVFALTVGLYMNTLVAAIHRQLTGGTKAADAFN